MWWSPPTEGRAPSEEEARAFWRDGYWVAPGLASGGALRHLRALAERHHAARTPPVEWEADLAYPGAPAAGGRGGATLRRLLQAFGRDQAFRDWALGDGVKGVLAALFAELCAGPDKPIALSQCHHNCVMTKAPGYSSATLWHRDIRYWAFQRQELISAWLALGREDRANGCLRVIPGSHRLALPPERFDEAAFLRPGLAENKALMRQALPVELDAGDCLFFHCKLLHAAGRNLGAATKYSLVFAYHQADNQPIADTRSASLPAVALP